MKSLKGWDFEQNINNHNFDIIFNNFNLERIKTIRKILSRYGLFKR